MDSRRQFFDFLVRLFREAFLELERESREFLDPLQDWVNQLVQRTLPSDWRDQLHAFLQKWLAEGFALRGGGVQQLEQWIESWAKVRGLLPSSDGSAAVQVRPSLPRSTKPQLIMRKVSNQPKSVSKTAAAGNQNSAVVEAANKPASLSPHWPRLTPKELERIEREAGIPWWYPFQPSNRIDSFWERILEDFGRLARQRLLDVFRELAIEGRMAQRSTDPPRDDVEQLLVQHAKVQRAYDLYVLARTDIYEEWTRYLSMGYPLIGIHVAELVNKLDRALPARIEGIESPFDESLMTAAAKSSQAFEKARGNAEIVYEALLWADRIITAVEVLALAGAIKVAARKTFTTAIAEGLTESAARKLAVRQVIVEVATAVGTGAVVGTVVPKVLDEAGLDEAEVRAGLAVFTSVFSVLGLRAVVRRKPSSGPHSSPAKPDVPTRESDSPSTSTAKPPTRKKKTKPRKKPQDGKPRTLSPREARMRVGSAFNRLRRAEYKYNEIRVHKPDRPGHYILDSYDDARKEIVFRRVTQFSEIKLATARGYLREFVSKYPPGTVIADTPANPPELRGKKLEGVMYFEVPVQWKKIPHRILDEAAQLEIRIRDTNGKVY